MTQYRIADSTVVEPLINYWSAWAHLLSPVPASLHLLHHQIPTMQSYLADPAFHVQAAHDPNFAGGPFSDIPVERAEEIRQLLASTEAKQSENLALAQSLTDFHNRLVDEAKGQSLEPYYQELPEHLRGYVELVYDYYNNPTVRFFEGMLYQSKYYDRSLQSLRIASVESDNSRPFFMSTPRLPEKDQIDWRVAFDDSSVDEFFKLDTAPQPLGAIREILGLEAADERKLLPLLTERPAAPSEKWRERDVRIRYYGHACALVEWSGISVMVDPYISALPLQRGIDRYSYQDLPDTIDYALITHSHQDHFALETLLRLRHRIGCLVVPKSYGVLHGDTSLKLMALKLKFKQVIELDTLESIYLPDGEIIGVPFLGEHSDLGHGKSGYIIRAGNEQILLAADSDCLDRRIYENIRQTLGAVETVFLGTESVGAPLTWHAGSLLLRRPTREHDQTRRSHGCNAESALHLLEAVGAKRVYNYAMGKEPWLEHLLGLGFEEDSPQLTESRKLLERAHGRGFLIAERPFGKEEIYLPRSSRPATSAGRQITTTDTPAGMHAPTLHADTAIAVADYWRRKLGGNLPRLALPAARPETEIASPAGARQSTALELPPELWATLDRLSVQRGCSLSTIVLSAFEVLLYRYTGQDDLLLGACIDDPRMHAPERLCDSNGSLLVLRTDLSGNPDFLTQLDRTREVVARAVEHRGLPLEILPELLANSDGAFRQPLFQVIFMYHETTTAGSSPSTSAMLDALKDTEALAESELILRMARNGSEVNLTLEYDSAMFDAETVAAMLHHFHTLLDGIASGPHQSLLDLPLLGESHDADDAPSEKLDDIGDTEDQFVF